MAEHEPRTFENEPIRIDFSKQNERLDFDNLVGSILTQFPVNQDDVVFVMRGKFSAGELWFTHRGNLDVLASAMGQIALVDVDIADVVRAVITGLTAIKQENDTFTPEMFCRGEIIRELTKTFARLNMPPLFLAALNSFDYSLKDKEVLETLQAMNADGTIFNDVIASANSGPFLLDNWVHEREFEMIPDQRDESKNFWLRYTRKPGTKLFIPEHNLNFPMAIHEDMFWEAYSKTGNNHNWNFRLRK